MEFRIDVPPRTKKNSQRIVVSRGRRYIIPSKSYKQFESECKDYVPYLQIDYKVNIKALFYMDTKRRVDLVNLQEALLDVLVKYGCIVDDNSNIVASMDGSRVLYDKYFPRIEVEIEREE